MSSEFISGQRQCAKVINSLHSIYYFAPEPEAEFSRHGISDSMGTYFASRAAPLGATEPGTIAALFNAFSYDLVSGHIPSIWEAIAPRDAVAARLRAAGRALRRLLGEDVRYSRDLSEAAKLAGLAAQACTRPGRALYSANADLETPDDPLLALWHAATLLREYRGDGHVTVLGSAELTGLDSLIFDCASPAGMPADIVLEKRGWTAGEIETARQRLRDRGLMDARCALTPAGARLREDIESETDRLDRSPYESLGPAGVSRLTLLVRHLVIGAAGAGAFPPPLRDFFVRPR